MCVETKFLGSDMTYQVHEATEMQRQSLSLELSLQRFQKTSPYISYFPWKPQNEDSKGLLFAIQTQVSRDSPIPIVFFFFFTMLAMTPLMPRSPIEVLHSLQRQTWLLLLLFST